jgi:hypothetical protein
VVGTNQFDVARMKRSLRWLFYLEGYPILQTALIALRFAAGRSKATVETHG